MSFHHAASYHCGQAARGRCVPTHNQTLPHHNEAAGSGSHDQRLDASRIGLQDFSLTRRDTGTFANDNKALRVRQENGLRFSNSRLQPSFSLQSHKGDRWSDVANGSYSSNAQVITELTTVLTSRSAEGMTKSIRFAGLSS